MQPVISIGCGRCGGATELYVRCSEENSVVELRLPHERKAIDVVHKRHYNVTMASITVRNIPEEVLERIRALSSIERRSLNNEILVILERGTFSEYEEKLLKRKFLSKSTQMDMWKRLVGTWEDTRSAKEIIEDIYSNRTAGREVEL
jgi:plasmid stability protein